MSETSSKPDARQLERLAAFLRLIPEGSQLDRLLKGAALLEEPPTNSAELAGDILHGAAAIAHCLYGHEKHRRKVYNLNETNRLPHFRLGSSLCARRSVLLAWITAQEQGSENASL